MKRVYESHSFHQERKVDKAELYMLSDRYQEAIEYLRENEPRPTAN